MQPLWRFKEECGTVIQKTPEPSSQHAEGVLHHSACTGGSVIENSLAVVNVPMGVVLHMSGCSCLTS